MTNVLGVLLLIAALPLGAVGGFWAFMKAGGAEVDYCGGSGGGCISGWYPAAILLLAAATFALLGVALLKIGPRGERGLG